MRGPREGAGMGPDTPAKTQVAKVSFGILVRPPSRCNWTLLLLEEGLYGGLLK